VLLLAKNTGTSSNTIERFYGQVKLERMAKELRPEWRTGPGGRGGLNHRSRRGAAAGRTSFARTQSP
jgi:hypothetical protein